MSGKVTFAQFSEACVNPNILGAADMLNVPPFEFRMVLYAQACHETANFAAPNDLYRKKSNIFGMRCSLVRKTLWIPPQDGVKEMGATQMAQTILTYKKQIQNWIKKNPASNVSPYANYSMQLDGRDWPLSLCDRLNWDVYNGIAFDNVNSYLSQVQSKGYATDPNYIVAWRKWIDKIFAENIAGPPPPDPNGNATSKTPIWAFLLGYLFLR